MTSTLALAYLRVSTLGQVEHGASLDAQETILRDEAERRGWDVEFIREEGRSAKNLNREKLQEALRRLDKGEAQVLLSVRLDRISRSVSDFSQLMARSQRRGWEIVVSGSAIDTTGASGKFSAHILAAAAEFERDMISTRTREGMAQKRLEGKTFGREVHPDFIATYRRVLAMHATGSSMNGIAVTLKSEGVPTARGGQWTAATVRRIVLSETAKAL